MKLLPPGDYIVRVLAVLGEHVDGGLLILRWTTPARQELMADAARKGIDVVMPKQLKELTARSCIVMGLEFKPGSLDGFCLYASVPITEAIDVAKLRELLLIEVQRHVDAFADRMIGLIGIDPASYDFQLDRRPEHLS